MWMGLNKRPQFTDYWSSDALYRNDVSKLMSRNTYKLILKNLHFSDNNKADKSDRMAKLNPMLDNLQENFQNVCSRT